MRTVQTELRFPVLSVVSNQTRMVDDVVTRVILLEDRIEEGVAARVTSDDWTAKVTGISVELNLIKNSILHPFTVVGIYDHADRFCDHVEALDADAAEDQVLAERPDATVCAVFAGHLHTLDNHQ